MVALRDEALPDLGRLHLMFLLDTAYWCRFSYLRDALRLTDDRLRRQVRVLRSHGYAATSRDTTGAGWANLTPLGAARRDAQFAAFLKLPAAARGHRARTRVSKPDWFTPDKVAITDAAPMLVADLDAVAAHLPLIATELRTRTLTSVRQHTIGALLIELGENLHQHADTHSPPNPSCTQLKPSSAHDSEPS